MSSRRNFRGDLRAVCSEIGENDGHDPRFDKIQPRMKVLNRKALQLCARVAETIALVLGGELNDDMLRELRVESVVPMPTSAQLLVTLAVPDLGEELTHDHVRQRLAVAEAKIRAEVGRSIHRRRVPGLFYNLVRKPG